MTTAGMKRATSADCLQRLVLSLTALVLTMIIAAALAALGWWVTRNRGYEHAYPLMVTFGNTQGVDAGAPVTMAGVKIGQVQQVRLNGGRADMDIQIKEGVAIPKGSHFVAMPALFALPGDVEVIAPANGSMGSGDAIAPHEANLVGQAGSDPAEALAKANHLMEQLAEVGQKSAILLDATNHAVRAADGALKDGKIQGDIRGAISDVRSVSINGAEATRQLKALLAELRTPARDTFINLSGLTSDMRGMTKASRPVLTATLADLKQTAASANHLTAQADDLMKAGNYGPRLSEVLTTFADTANNLKSLSDKMNTIADSAQKVVGDPQTAANLTEIVRNMKTTTDTLKSAMEKMDTLLAGTKPLFTDPIVLDDTKAALHNLREVSEISVTLLQQMAKAAGKGGKK